MRLVYVLLAALVVPIILKLTVIVDIPWWIILLPFAIPMVVAGMLAIAIYISAIRTLGALAYGVVRTW